MENMKDMEKAGRRIRTYIENMFASLPKTEQAIRMKEDMYCSMLDKYNGYISEGAGEDEAFGRIVDEFGSVEDIRTELAQSVPQPDESPAQKSKIPAAENISPERKKQYDKYKIIQGIAVALGVVCCILAVFGSQYLSVSFFGNSNDPQILTFGLLVALGVFLFVWAGTGESKFYDITLPEALRPDVSEERMKEYRCFIGVRQWLISFAVALFVVCPFIYDCDYGMIIMPVLVAVGVGILIVVGAVHDTYSDVRTDKDDK